MNSRKMSGLSNSTIVRCLKEAPICLPETLHISVTHYATPPFFPVVKSKSFKDTNLGVAYASCDP